MLKLSSSRGVSIDVPVLSVSWSFEDHSVIIQALRRDVSSARPVILEESLAESPLVQIVWQRLQYLDNSRNSVGGVWRKNWAVDVGYSKLGRCSE